MLILYSMLTNRLEFTLEVDSKRRTLTRDALMSYAFSPRAELREAAYRELYRVYEGEATVLGQIYVNRVRDWASEKVGLRRYGSPIAVRNLHNDVPDEAVDVLLERVAADVLVTTVTNGEASATTTLDGSYDIDHAGYDVDLLASNLAITFDHTSHQVTYVTGELVGEIDIPDFAFDVDVALVGAGTAIQVGLDFLDDSIHYTRDLY
jgi:hypothetical protein